MRYAVTIPVTGRAYVEVEAISEEEAVELAKEEVPLDEITEWDVCETIVKGNIFCGEVRRIIYGTAGNIVERQVWNFS